MPSSKVLPEAGVAVPRRWSFFRPWRRLQNASVAKSETSLRQADQAELSTGGPRTTPPSTRATIQTDRKLSAEATPRGRTAIGTPVDPSPRSAREPVDLASAFVSGSLSAKRLLALLEASFGPAKTAPYDHPFAQQFWSSAYAHATESESLSQTACLLEGLLVALEWPCLRKAFLATDGPFWLSWLHMALPGGAASTALPNEALLDSQLALLQGDGLTGTLSVNSSSRTHHSLTGRDPGSSRSASAYMSLTNSAMAMQAQAAAPVVAELPEKWAALECRDDLLETRTWRLGCKSARESHRAHVAEGDLAPPLLWPMGQVPESFASSLDSAFAALATSRAGLLRHRLSTREHDEKSEGHKGESGRAESPAAPSLMGANEGEGTSFEVEKSSEVGFNIPRLHLKSIPAGLAPALTVSRGARNTSVLVGALLRGTFASAPADETSEADDSFEAWVRSGGAVSLSEVLEMPPLAPASDIEAVERLVCTAFQRLLKGKAQDRSEDATVVEAAAVFLCTANARALGAANQASPHLQEVLAALAEVVEPHELAAVEGKQAGSRESVRALLYGASDSDSSPATNHLAGLAAQLANRCLALSAVERKVMQVQQQRGSLGAPPSDRQRWVQQLCCCAVERSLYALRLRDLAFGNAQPSEAPEERAAPIARSCIVVLAPLIDLVRAATTAGHTNLAHLQAPAVHACCAALEEGLRLYPQRVLAVLGRDDRESNAALAVLTTHCEWLLSEAVGGHSYNGNEGLLRPLPAGAATSMVQVCLRFWRRLAETATLAVVLHPPSSSSVAAGRSVLTSLAAEDVHECLLAWLDHFTSAQPMLTRQSLQPCADVVAALVALYSDPRPLPVSHNRAAGPAAVAAAAVALLTKLGSEAAAVTDPPLEEIDAEAAREVGCLCLRLVGAAASGRGVGEAPRFKSTVTALLQLISAAARASIQQKAPPPDAVEPPSPTGKPPPFRLGSQSSHLVVPEVTYAVGDRVRGKWQLSNGKERWFPGVVTAVEEGGCTYSVQYDDGDIQINKPAADLRPQRRVHRDTTKKNPEVASIPTPQSLSSSSEVPSDCTPLEAPSSPVPAPPAATAEDKKAMNETPRIATATSEPSTPVALRGAREDDEDDDLFVTIRSNLTSPSKVTPPPKRQLKKSMSTLDLASVHALTQESGEAGRGSGFSALGGFGLVPDDEGAVPSPTPLSQMSDGFQWLSQAPAIHELALAALLALVLTPDGRRLETSAIDSNQSVDWSALSLVDTLHRHLSLKASPAVAPLLRQLHVRCANSRTPTLAWLLRLLAAPLFDGQAYASDLNSSSAGDDGDDDAKPMLLGQGAFGRVISCACPVEWPMATKQKKHGSDTKKSTRVAVKFAKRSRNSGGVARALEELSALHLCGPLHAPRLLDAGYLKDQDEFVVVMEQCAETLKAWRAARDDSSAAEAGQEADRGADARPVSEVAVQQYLSVFRQVTEAVCALAGRGIIHFDIKADNVFLRHDPLKEGANGAVCIGDFGEAVVVDASKRSSGVRLQRARGTECIQSPEMLLVQASTGSLSEPTSPVAPASPTVVGQPLPAIVASPASASTSTNEAADGLLALRYRREYVSCASDVWSLGCLLFELLTGDFLFDISPEEGGWSRLFVLLTQASDELFLPRKLALLRSIPYASVLEHLLRALLVRDPDDRPSAQQALSLVDAAIAEVTTAAAADSTQNSGSISATAPGSPAPCASPPELTTVPSTSAAASAAAVSDLPDMKKSGGKDELSRPLVWQLCSSLVVVEQCSMNFEAGNLSLPFAWMDSALTLAAHVPWSPAHLNALGITHVLRLSTTSATSPELRATSPRGDATCAQCECNACKRHSTSESTLVESSERAPLDLDALERAVAFLERAAASGGRSLVLSGTRGSAIAVTVALGMQRGASLLDAFLEVHAVISGPTLTAADTDLLFKWGDRHKGQVASAPSS